jgi:hypothetical protein
MNIIPPDMGDGNALPSGEQLKQAALNKHEQNRPQFLLKARHALLAAMLRNGQATADDVRHALDIPEHINPKCLGAVPTALAKARIIASDGFRKSVRRSAHARPVTVWRLIDPSAALAWLAENPIND